MLLTRMDCVALDEVPKPIRAEEHTAAYLYVINTAVKNVIAQRLGTDSEQLRGSRDIEQILKPVPAVNWCFGWVDLTWLGRHCILVTLSSQSFEIALLFLAGPQARPSRHFRVHRVTPGYKPESR